MRENIQMTAITIRTEAHLVREGGHNIHEIRTQMLVFATSTIKFQERKRKNEELPLLWDKFWVGPISNEDKMFLCPGDQT